MSKPNTFEVFSNYELPPFNNIEYFLILDTSSSMGNYIPQIIQFGLQDKYVGKQVQKFKNQFLIKDYTLILIIVKYPTHVVFYLL